MLKGWQRWAVRVSKHVPVVMIEHAPASTVGTRLVLCESLHGSPALSTPEKYMYTCMCEHKQV